MKGESVMRSDFPHLRPSARPACHAPRQIRLESVLVEADQYANAPATVAERLDPIEASQSVDVDDLPRCSNAQPQPVQELGPAGKKRSSGSAPAASA
jgi:hypothetical protein